MPVPLAEEKCLCAECVKKLNKNENTCVSMEVLKFILCMNCWNFMKESQSRKRF